jgi:TRAP-type C4-dicarboxylate transport system permease small subunit
MNDTTPTADPTPLDRLATLATALSAFGLAGMVAVQAWQVVARYLLNDSPSWTEPLTLVLLSTTLSFGAAAGVHARSHFAFPLLVQRMPGTAQRALARLSAALIVGIGGLLAVGGARLLLDGLAVKMAGAPLPQGIAFLPLCAGGALMAVFALPQLWRPTLEAN